jgi:hypothetical protein
MLTAQVVQQGMQQLGPAAHLYKWQHGNVRVDQLRGVCVCVCVCVCV